MIHDIRVTLSYSGTMKIPTPETMVMVSPPKWHSQFFN